MSPLPRFLVEVVDVSSYRIEIEAPDSQTAEDLALESFIENGSDGFTFREANAEVGFVEEVQS